MSGTVLNPGISKKNPDIGTSFWGWGVWRANRERDASKEIKKSSGVLGVPMGAFSGAKGTAWGQLLIQGEREVGTGWGGWFVLQEALRKPWRPWTELWIILSVHIRVWTNFWSTLFQKPKKLTLSKFTWLGQDLLMCNICCLPSIPWSLFPPFCGRLWRATFAGPHLCPEVKTKLLLPWSLQFSETTCFFNS